MIAPILNHNLISTCLSDRDCADQCNIFFYVSLSEGDGNSHEYSISTIKGTIVDSPPDSLHGYNFSFPLDVFPNMVS